MAISRDNAALARSLGLQVTNVGGQPGDEAFIVTDPRTNQRLNQTGVTQAGLRGLLTGRGARVSGSVEAPRPGATGRSGSGGGGAAVNEGSNVGLAGAEFRTSQQRRAEAELAKQLGVERLSDVKPPDAPEVVDMKLAEISERPDQFVDTTNKLLGQGQDARVTTAATPIDISEAPVLSAPQGTATTVAGTERATTAAKKDAPTNLIGDIQIEDEDISEESKVVAATQDLDEKATTSFQLEQLFKGEGNFTTLFSKPIREATDRMLARGLGASSMAAAAIVQSTIESGIPIAREDANKFAAIQLANLNNEQQAALQNASTFAAIDQTNLSARLTRSVENAKSFLQIDTANLTNEQQANVLTAEARNQFLLSDQAAENAMEQLNVNTIAETDKFFSTLGVQVRDSNANRLVAVNEFNAGQTNTIEQFNRKQADQRERFDAEMRAEIDAANAQWRRQISTINNAAAQTVNEFNAREVNDNNIRDYNNLYQSYRDAAARIFQSAENNEARATALAQQELIASASGGRNSGSRSSSTLDTLGTVASIAATAAKIFGMCYVSREVYGTETNEWLKFRYWMYNESPSWFKNLYLLYGEPVAKFISNKPLLKKAIKYFMDKKIRKVQWNA